MTDAELQHLWESYLRLPLGALGAKAPTHLPPAPMSGLNGWSSEPEIISNENGDVVTVITPPAAPTVNTGWNADIYVSREPSANKPAFRKTPPPTTADLLGTAPRRIIRNPPSGAPAPK